jgi:hypothetical protein
MAERINYKYFTNKERERHFLPIGKDGISIYKRYISEALGRNDLSDFRFLRTYNKKCFVLKAYLPEGILKRIVRHHKKRRVQDGG